MPEPTSRAGASRLLFATGERVRGTRHFHVRAAARAELGLPAALFGISGTMLEADLDVLARMADWLGPEGPGTADLFAAFAIHELLHLLLDDLRLAGDFVPSQLFLKAAPGEAARLAASYAELFPAGDGHADTAAALDEELLLLRLHNRNPAFCELLPLLHDTELLEHPQYAALDELLTGAAAGGVTNADERTLSALRLLQAHQLNRPDSLAGQLEWFRDNLPLQTGLPELGTRLLLALDLLSEQNAPRFVGGPSAPPPPGTLVTTDAHKLQAADRDWMGPTVLIAKSCLVWLRQLSDRYGREINDLGGIPDEELAALASAGFTALWLIGLWRRSPASRRIKQLNGQPEAEASAYALFDYKIEPSLGGRDALERLKQRAAAHGLRLVSDMVPNHTGIDSRWVREHPDWFVQLTEPPFPSYTFTGPDLSDDPAVQIRLEDHYWDGSDAAVVFERTDAQTGEKRYIYHGNDGTGLPWNDTAQLDYLNPAVREAVLGAMVEVAGMFPVIRFDAAMTLVRRHVQRLWYPPPGSGGAIASRARYGQVSAEEFERRMPEEFWREATGRLAAEAPGTLLLAEAFWMLEGYFVQNLGMHRVYNSAFMHMLRDGANREFQIYLKGQLEQDPQVLGRLVNFMNNPDEDSAAAQFGTGDRYFVACTLLATLPGLPMFGHGQVEGLSEKYGMEFNRPLLHEEPRQDVLERHERQIFPLLRRRADFAGTGGFELLVFETQDGPCDDVIAFSNGGHVVVCNNSDRHVGGRLRRTVPRLRENGAVSAVGLTDALGLHGDARDEVVWSRLTAGPTGRVRLQDLATDGLAVELAAWSSVVLLDFRLEKDYGLEELGEALRSLGPVVAGDYRVRDRLWRLPGLLQSDQLASAWERLDDTARLWLVLQGLPGMQQFVPSGVPELLRELPWRPDAAWWRGREVSAWLKGEASQGISRLDGDRFKELAAMFALRGALKAGGPAGAELWDSLGAALSFSGLQPARLLRSLGAYSGG